MIFHSFLILFKYQVSLIKYSMLILPIFIHKFITNAIRLVYLIFSSFIRMIFNLTRWWNSYYIKMISFCYLFLIIQNWNQYLKSILKLLNHIQQRWKLNELIILLLYLINMKLLWVQHYKTSYRNLSNIWNVNFWELKFLL